MFLQSRRRRRRNDDQLRRRGADKKRPPSSVSLDAFGLEDLFCDGGLNESRTKDVELEIDANFSDAASFCRTEEKRTNKKKTNEKTNNGFSSVHVALSKGMERKPFSNNKKKKNKSTDQKTVRADDMCVYVLLKVMERNNKAFFFF